MFSRSKRPMRRRLHHAASRAIVIVDCAWGLCLLTAALAAAESQGVHIGSQPATHGLPTIAVRRHWILGTSALPDGEFYEVHVLKSRDVPAVNISQLLPHGWNASASCAVNAARIPEPMTPLYDRRHGPPRSLPGGIPRAFFQWQGNITRADYDAIPYTLRGPLCGHCTNFASYKILNGQLYRGPDADANPEMAHHRKFAEDMLLVVLYTWDIPNMDIKLHFGDGCPSNVPAFSWNICRDKANAGFTMPSASAWAGAMGPVQTQVYHACLGGRYRHDHRRPVAFWRGTNTDPNLVDNFTYDTYRQATRIRLHMDFKPTEKTHIDAQLSKLIHADPRVRAAVGNLAPRVHMEDFNDAAVILDLDGNGWSNRWARIMHFPTFVLKQASNHTAFFEHLMASGHLGYFRNDLSDLQLVVNRTLQAWRAHPLRLQLETQKRQAFAAAVLHQMGVAEAMGYSLMAYYNRTTWQAVMEPGYLLVPFRRACTAGRTNLPQQLCINIRRHRFEEQTATHRDTVSKPISRAGNSFFDVFFKWQGRST